MALQATGEPPEWDVIDEGLGIPRFPSPLCTALLVLPVWMILLFNPRLNWSVSSHGFTTGAATGAHRGH